MGIFTHCASPDFTGTLPSTIQINMPSEKLATAFCKNFGSVEARKKKSPELSKTINNLREPR